MRQRKMKSIIISSMSVLFLFMTVENVYAAVIEVTQPTQITNNLYYERGESILKDINNNYWMFYGRSEDFTGNYGTGNPDNHHYVIYYKTATTIEGLANATPQLVPNMPTGTDKIYQGQTAACEFESRIYVFATDMSHGSPGDIVYWYYNGTVWSTMHDTGFDGHHLDVLTHNGKIWLSWNAGNTVKVASYNGTSWSSAITIQGCVVSGPITRLYEDLNGRMILYFTNGWSITPDVYYFYVYDDVTGSWPSTPSATLNIEEPSGVHDCDPLLVERDGKYLFVWAPWDDVATKQWLYYRTSQTLDGLQSDTTKWFTYGGYPGTPMVDMWPRAVIDGDDVYIFYTSERTAEQETVRGTGNIWMMVVEWDIDRDHFDYIQPAINEASHQDTIFVHDGIYNENILIDKELIIRGTSLPTIDGRGVLWVPAVEISGDGVTFQGFIVRNFKADEYHDSAAIFVHSSDVTIKTNIIEDILSSTTEPFGMGIDVWTESGTNTNVEITSNVVRNVDSVGIRMRDNWDNPSGVETGILIKNNRVYKTGNTGVLITGYIKGVTILNNRIYKSLEPTPYNLFVHYGASNVLIEDNHIYDTYGNVVLAGCNNVVVKNNIIEDAIPLPSNPDVKGKNVYILNDYGNWTGNSTLLTTHVTIVDNDILNGGYGVRFLYTANDGDPSSMTLTTTINHNTIYGNTIYGIENGIETDVNATYNWWNTNTGPYHSTTNPSGLGDAVSDNVVYNPWLNLTLNLTSPEEDKPYDKRKILIEVSTNLVVDAIKYSVDGGKFRTLCKNCNSYSRKKTFSDGNHTLIVKAILGTEEVSKVVSFLVDTKRPRIIKTLPNHGDVIKGTTFYVKYTEDNLVKVTLHWKNSTEETYHHVELEGCSSGRNEECTVEINLLQYNGQSIDYYFSVEDPISTVNSTVKTITIDCSEPIVEIYSPTMMIYNNRRINMSVGINEFVRVLEYSVDGGKFRTLCKNCNSYSRKKTFSDGNHTLIVKATDYAGNIGESVINFTVDSRKPRIIRQYPRNLKYTNGTFTVVYNEDNLKNVSLYYKGILETTYKEITKSTCESGIKKKCEFNVNLTEYEGFHINYYFVVRNHVSETTGKVYTVTVDTTTPMPTILSPVDGMTYPRRVRLNISVSEEVKLEYSDNGRRYRRLCSRCDVYDRIFKFRHGPHELLVRAIDKAGNEGYASVTFIVEDGVY